MCLGYSSLQQGWNKTGKNGRENSESVNKVSVNVSCTSFFPKALCLIFGAKAGVL